MGKPLNLPADLIADWARRHAAANAKLEGIEIPDDFVMSVQAQQFLNMRRGNQSVKPLVIEMQDIRDA